MKSTIIFLFAACLVGTAFAHPTMPHRCSLPTPVPENQLLAIWYGEWAYKGEYFKTPVSEASTFTGHFTGRAILNGWASEFIFIENGVYSYEIDMWDPAAGRYSFVFMTGEDYIERGYYDMEGTTCVFTSSFIGADGIQYTLDGVEPISKDGRTLEKTITLKWRTADGKDMAVPYFYAKYIKIKHGRTK